MGKNSSESKKQASSTLAPRIPAWIRSSAEGITLYCQIQPRASRSEIAGPHGEPPRLKIRIAAPPVDGEANEELILFLSELLKIPKSNFTLVSGHTGKLKEIFILNATSDHLAPLLI